jgi:hypothetical protein
MLPQLAVPHKNRETIGKTLANSHFFALSSRFFWIFFALTAQFDTTFQLNLLKSSYFYRWTQNIDKVRPRT